MVLLVAARERGWACRSIFSSPACGRGGRALSGFVCGQALQAIARWAAALCVRSGFRWVLAQRSVAAIGFARGIYDLQRWCLPLASRH